MKISDYSLYTFFYEFDAPELSHLNIINPDKVSTKATPIPGQYGIVAKSHDAAQFKFNEYTRPLIDRNVKVNDVKWSRIDAGVFEF